LGILAWRRFRFVTTTKPKTQAPLKVDPAVDALITQGAHFLDMTKKELVAEAVRAYLTLRREELAAGMREAMRVLDGTNRSRLALLTGIPPERIDELGGIRE
jgi:hypothetical protein